MQKKWKLAVRMLASAVEDDGGDDDAVERKF